MRPLLPRRRQGIVFLLIVIRITRNTAAGSPAELARRSMLQLNGSSCQIPNLSLSTTAVHAVDVERRGHLSSPLSSPIAIHVSVSMTSDTASDEWPSAGDEKLDVMEKMLSEDMLRSHGA